MIVVLLAPVRGIAHCSTDIVKVNSRIGLEVSGKLTPEAIGKRREPAAHWENAVAGKEQVVLGSLPSASCWHRVARSETFLSVSSDCWSSRVAAIWSHWGRSENHFVSDAGIPLILFPLSFPLLFNKRHLKRLALPVLLQVISEAEGIVHLVGLEDVEAAIQGDFPAVVGHDVAGVDRAGAVERPGEVHTHAACGLLHLLEVFLLLFGFEFVCSRQQMHGHFLIRGLVLDHCLQKIHEIANLVEQADVRIGDCDCGRALEVGADLYRVSSA